ncbi:MAG: tetratricopeptide repeat protein [Anaerolineales bacterium]|nr:tetratricopeptide repeat protein [Anaerolineales bacterium]
MYTPILATKLFIPPPRPKAVPRPHLIERLNEGLHRKLTLISAPAGFGKTTLVSEWLAASQEQAAQRAAWLSLDEGDSDLTRFLAYLVAALQTITATIGEGILGALHSPQPPPREALLTTLLNEITATAHAFVLVLDDYHVLDAASPLGTVDQALAFLLEHLPPQMHLVITTREDPQLPLARLRARGQMTELRAADLRFTPGEAAAFLNQVMNLDLSAAQVAALEARTEGWIAGLQLAALSLRGRKDVGHFVTAFAGDHRYIVDYLVEEVLQRQPDRVRSFLLQTSILERLSGSLCDAVTGGNDGTALLDLLERSNLFVVPLDDQRRWFRYHHLFADVLAAHARLEQPTLVPLLHQRAGAWYAAHGLPADAIRHALAAQDYARAAGLIERAWPAMDGSFRSAAWLGWARALPDEWTRARPVLGVAYAWALLNGGEFEAAESRLEEAEPWLDPAAQRGATAAERVIVDEEQFRALPASIATARAYMTLARGDLAGAVKYAARALSLLPKADHLRRGPAAALLGLAHWADGDLEAAHRALADAMAGFREVGSLHFAISATYGLGDIRTAQGRLREAVQTYTQTLQLALAQGEPPLRGTADLYLGLAELYREQGDQDAALRNLLHSEELGEQAGLADWRYRFHRAQARFKQSQGDLAGALDLFDEAARHRTRTPVPDVRPLAAWKVRVWLLQGRVDEARRWAQERRLSVDDDLSFLREFEHITLARVLMAESPRGHEHALLDALRLLERLQHAAQAGGRMGSVIEILALQALAHQAQGNLAPALLALEHALRLAEPEGYVGLFVDEGPPLARLLSAAAAHGIMPDYTGKLPAAFAPATAGTPRPDDARDPTQRPPSSPAQPLNVPLVEPLSARELDVLGLVAQGLSNDEIAARLFLSLSTVKGHNRNIFAKLQVQRRTEAVARARRLGLL